MSDALAVGRSVKICSMSVEMQRLASMCGKEQLLRENSSWQIGLVHGPREAVPSKKMALGGTALRQHTKRRLAAVCPIPVAWADGVSVDAASP